MELLQLKYFKKVAETGKISTAAAALYISSPALSATISRLEKELGVKLFDRHSNRISLNRQGEIFLRYVNQVFTSLECARTEISQSMLRADNQVRIAVTSADVWREMLSYFTEAHPEVRLTTHTLTVSQMEAMTLTGPYAFLLAAEGDAPPGIWEQRLLFVDRLTLMVHRENPLAGKGTAALQDIEGQRLFLPPADHAFNRQIRALLRDAGFSADTFDECADAVCRTMVLDNRGITFTTRYTDPDGDEEIVYIPMDGDRCRWRQMICWDRDRILRPEEEIFRNFVVDFYQNHKHALP